MFGRFFKATEVMLIQFLLSVEIDKASLRESRQTPSRMEVFGLDFDTGTDCVQAEQSRQISGRLWTPG